MGLDVEIPEGIRSSERAQALRSAIRDTKAEIDTQLEAVRKLRPLPGAGEVFATKEAAILGAMSDRLLGYRQQLAAVELQIGLHETTNTLATAMTALTSEIRDFTTKADQGTNRLAFWTTVLAVVTGLLAIAAIAQVWVMFAARPA